MPDLDALASWLQDRTYADEAFGIGWRVGSEAVLDSDLTDPNLPISSSRIRAQAEAIRTLLADLMDEPHDSYCGSTCTSAHVCDRSCSCDRDARVLRRLRILASPYAGRDDMPAELREETRG